MQGLITVINLTMSTNILTVSPCPKRCISPILQGASLARVAPRTHKSSIYANPFTCSATGTFVFPLCGYWDLAIQELGELFAAMQVRNSAAVGRQESVGGGRGKQSQGGMSLAISGMTVLVDGRCRDAMVEACDGIVCL